uniref:Uncharacterized protein n=1 Tax=Compsopogon caeruleus TaxID=31354 RepID=A0A7S1XFU3_9RHOD
MWEDHAQRGSEIEDGRIAALTERTRTRVGPDEHLPDFEEVQSQWGGRVRGLEEPSAVTPWEEQPQMEGPSGQTGSCDLAMGLPSNFEEFHPTELGGPSSSGESGPPPVEYPLATASHADNIPDHDLSLQDREEPDSGDVADVEGEDPDTEVDTEEAMGEEGDRQLPEGVYTGAEAVFAVQEETEVEMTMSEITNEDPDAEHYHPDYTSPYGYVPDYEDPDRNRDATILGVAGTTTQSPVEVDDGLPTLFGSRLETEERAHEHSVPRNRVLRSLPEKRVPVSVTQLPKSNLDETKGLPPQEVRSSKGPLGVNAFVLRDHKIKVFLKSGERNRYVGTLISEPDSAIVSMSWCKVGQDPRFFTLVASTLSGKVWLFFLFVETSIEGVRSGIRLMKSRGFRAPAGYYSKVQTIGVPENGILSLTPSDGDDVHFVSFKSTGTLSKVSESTGASGADSIAKEYVHEAAIVEKDEMFKPGQRISLNETELVETLQKDAALTTNIQDTSLTDVDPISPKMEEIMNLPDDFEAGGGSVAIEGRVFINPDQSKSMGSRQGEIDAEGVAIAQPYTIETVADTEVDFVADLVERGDEGDGAEVGIEDTDPVGDIDASGETLVEDEDLRQENDHRGFGDTSISGLVKQMASDIESGALMSDDIHLSKTPETSMSMSGKVHGIASRFNAGASSSDLVDSTPSTDLESRTGDISGIIGKFESGEILESRELIDSREASLETTDVRKERGGFEGVGVLSDPVVNATSMRYGAPVMSGSSGLLRGPPAPPEWKTSSSNVSTGGVTTPSGWTGASTPAAFVSINDEAIGQMTPEHVELSSRPSVAGSSRDREYSEDGVAQDFSDSVRISGALSRLSSNESVAGLPPEAPELPTFEDDD